MENIWIFVSKQVRPAINFLGFEFYLYGILIGIGSILGICTSEKLLGKNKEGFWLVLAIGAITGSRIYHVLDKWDYYIAHLGEIPDLGNGGLGIFGAIIGGGIAMFIYSKLAKSKFSNLSDKVTVAAVLAQSIGRWGNFFNMEGYGPPTNLPWRIYIKPDLRPAGFTSYEYFHPLFLYESILLFLLFVFMYKFVTKLTPGSGKLTGVYLLGYGLIRLITELFRHDTWILGGVRVALALSLISALIGILIVLSSKRSNITRK